MASRKGTVRPLTLLDLDVEVLSIPMSAEERARWAAPGDECEACGEVFAHRKQMRTAAGRIIHKTCPVYETNGRGQRVPVGAGR
jgi:hypothetical protein